MNRHAALGISHNAPPSASSTFLPSSSSGGRGQSLASRLKPNLGGRTAFERERELSARYGAFSGAIPQPRKSEWEVLKENHRFIRDDEEPSSVSWEERLARAYESQLFKEFALIDLKHYKSKKFALRWRTAVEVVEGVGEDSCAGLRCKYHGVIPAASRSPSPSPRRGRRWDDDESEDEDGRDRKKRRRETKGRRMPPLKAFELPFRYEEAGEMKEALVKVRLCPRCVGKLLYKPKEDRPPSSADEAEEEKDERDDRTERRTRRLEDARHDDGRRKERRREREERDREERKETRERSRDRHRDVDRLLKVRSRSPRRRNEI